MSIKRTRCKNGTRKNKKTGKCESVLDNTCPICLERIISNNVKTKCKHNFHKGCLIGWCKSYNNTDPLCPICRSNIKDTCKKIMPFDSKEIFRYTNLAGAGEPRTKYSLEKINEIIYNKKFDINVQNENGKSVLYELSANKHSRSHNFIPFVEYLLKNPKIIVQNEIISKLIAFENREMIAIYKKHKKIPKHLKNLID